MTEWQTIDTAPRDGTQILLCQAYDIEGTPIDALAWGLFVQVAAWWGEEDEWIVYCSMPCDPALHFEPTHWMPLPANPAVQP